MAAGNRSVLVILDSRRVAERAGAECTIFAALDHMGVSYEVLECADYWALPPRHLAPRAAYVIAHDGAGAGLKPDTAAALAEAVAQGTGLVSFDREMAAWPPALRALLPGELTTETTESIRIENETFVTGGHHCGETIELQRPLAVAGIPNDADLESLVATAEGTVVVAAGQRDEGRIVLFGTGNALYDESVFGHVRGLDGLLWRSLVWVAAKPFPTRSIPPFVTARIDDCNGTYSAFDYVNAFNRAGISPNIGLFTDELGPTDWKAAKRLFDAGGADFSMHAFRDDFYKARPNYKPFSLLADKPDLSHGGQQTAFEGLSMDHTTGRDLDSATVRQNFRRMDDAFGKAGIRHSRVLNAHFGEIGWRAVPEFLARKVDLPTNNSVVGQLYGNQPDWRPKPYGVRGTNGRYGLVIDRCPQHPGMTCVGMSVSHLGKTHMVTDILHGHTPFLGEADSAKPGLAIERGINNVTIGLDSLAYGIIMTHEERIDAISLDDWSRIVTGIAQGLGSWDAIFASRESVSITCKRLFDSALVHADWDGQALHCELCGQTEGASPLTVWHNTETECARTIADIPAIAGFATVDLPG
ncbi:MAG: hypothetical protein HN742_15225 [Lentisphaerae bacterium]|jgi:hypothetical protein|nr:hypothetical protein [Lentisphaerota bacterium]MBT4814397.1 hypothetical protein [Lentisphaerota bacterium]MBT5608511.1 hypothetical protein [Lentisphaerota bacterium]MBT7058519.1 hypothetical protein [Lentisphaerota bacterium]MBT7843228.1 hypothetical protein [Lentisphaerota bacterium]